MPEQVAQGYIDIDVRDEGALNRLRGLDRELDRHFAKWDREDAEAELDLNIRPLENKLKQARRKLRALQGKRANVTADLAKKKLDKEIDLVQKSIKRLDGQKATLEIETHGAREAIALQERVAKRQAELDRHLKRMAQERLREAQRVARIDAQAEKDRLARIKREASVSLSLRRQQERELASAERAAHRENALRDATIAKIRQESDEIPTLQKKYVQLANVLDGIDARRRKAARVGDERAVLLIDIEEREAITRMESLREELERRGGPIELEVQVHRGQRSGQLLHDIVTNRDRASAVALGVALGGAIDAGIRSRLRPGVIWGNLMTGAGRFGSRTASILQNLTNMTIRLGPFTATIRQAILGMTVLGPTIIDVAGSLGSLIGVLGSATAGLGALSVGFLGGAIPAAIGFLGVLKPVTEQFKEAMSASESYNDAVLKYGKGSEQAATAQKKLNQVLKGVDAETRKSFKSAGNLSDKWREATAPARASAFKVIGQGLRFASNNMDMFAARTNRGFEIAQKGVSRWIKGLDSFEGRNILGNMMDNFNEALGPALDGLGSIATYLGRVGSVASNFLPGFARQFRDWADGVADGAANTAQLQQRVRGWIDSLRSVGRFLLAGGRLMRTFFGGGVQSGQRFLDTMTNAMNRWNAFLQTAEGRRDLATFFDRAVTGAQALWALLAPIGSAFVRWATALSPIVAGFMQVTGLVANFVGKIMALTVLRGPLTALGATLGAIWAVGKIGAATSAVINFTRALFGLQAASAGVAALGTATAATTARVAAGATAATAATHAYSRFAVGATATQTALAGATGAAAGNARQVGVLRSIAEKAIPAIAGLGTLAGGIATAGLVALGGAAAYGAYKFLSMQSPTEQLRDDFEELEKSSQKGAVGFRAVMMDAGTMGSQVHRARINVKQLRETLNSTTKGTREHRLALLDYYDGLRLLRDAEQQWNAVKERGTKAAKQQSLAEVQRASILQDIRRIQKERLDDETSLYEKEQLGEELADLQAELDKVDAAAERASNRQRALAGNLARAYRGLDPLIGRTEQQLGKLAKAGGEPLSKALAVKFETPQDVGRVAANATRALRSGVPQRLVTRIVADSKDAEDAMRRLNRVRITPKRVRVISEGGEEAVAMVERLSGIKLTPKQQKIVEEGGARALRVLERLIGTKLTPKQQRIAETGGRSVQRVLDRIKRTALGTATKFIREQGGSTVQNMLASLMGDENLGTATKTIRTVFETVQRRVGRADGGFATYSYAAGGTGATPDRARIDRAAAEAASRAVRNIRGGGRVSRPTLLAGEENRPEIVVSTNPRYRRRNQQYATMAARAVGLDVVAAAGGFPGGEPPPGPNLHTPNYSEMYGRPRFKSGRLTKRKRRRYARKLRGAKKYKAPFPVRGNPWAAALVRLDNRQNDLEREAQLRSDAVREPEDFIIETKRPDGEIDYSFDQANWDIYVSDIAQVTKVYEALKATVKEIAETIPRARARNDTQIRQHNKNIRVLRESIKQEERRARTKGDSDSAQKTRDNAQKRLTKLRDALGDEQQGRREKIQFGRTLSPMLTEAEFDWRGYEQELIDLATEVGRQRTSTEESIAEGNERTAAGGGGAEASREVQIATTAAEHMNVLRQFGGNANPNVRGFTGPPSPGGGGMQINPADYNVSGAAIAAATGGVSGAAVRSISGGAVSAGGDRAASMGAFAPGAPASGAAQVSGGTTRIVNVTNNYQTQPADPHTWSKSVEYELGAAV